MKSKFNSDYGCFLLVLRNINLGHFEETTPKTTPKTIKNRMEILKLISDKPTITSTELARQIGISVEGIKYHLKNLKDHEIIVHIGPNNGGYWKVIKELK